MLPKSGFFYDLPLCDIPSEAGVDQNSQFIEKALSVMEAEFDAAIEAALRVAQGKGASLEERVLMARFITVQFVRTRSFRNRLIEARTKTQEAVFNTVLQLLAPDLAEKLSVGVDYDKDTASVLHAQQMWDTSFLIKVATGLCYHLWFVGINNTDIPLYTSDSPVVLQSHKAGKKPSIDPLAGPGLTLATIQLTSKLPSPLSEGVEIIFPLTPTYALFMLEHKHFQHLEEKQGRAFRMSPDDVQGANALQVLQSNRQIYSVSNDFGLAQTICATKPEICNPQKDTVGVTATIHNTLNSN
ncbi:DUF4238 domain-containing protein [Leptolyngbya sp. FACHB-261]|uniref:DUF4238 domain-containing protein n=1 Tax=Leptolyngbya sp. FACHB-261 TaxID=2692806 RepID=UPI0016872198|nr:DUF4238 domain-containing protein [Leptolyngbya sp. FACHB-261]MBD2100381.1 DUF4238 domain-containing protein [Leptolyngbya sp. FACHB-261]